MNKNTPLLPIKPPLFKPIKHSLADWDFKPAGGLNISETTFVSPPSSLRQGGPELPMDWTWAFVKSAVIPCVAEGMFATWRILSSWFGMLNSQQIMVRTQAVPTNVYPANAYGFEIRHNYLYIKRWVAGGYAVLAEGVPPNPQNLDEWNHVAVQWYTYLDANLTTILRLRILFEVAGAWVEQLFVDDPSNRWAGSAINRVGFVLYTNVNPPYGYIDDTQVWKRAA